MTTCVVLLHGWPGSRHDFRLVEPLLAREVPTYVPDLRGFGEAFDGPLALEDATAEAHARRIVELLDAGGHERAVLAGYDVGSRVAQVVARNAPERVAGIVVTPFFASLTPYTQEPAMQAHYWYQHLHRLPLVERLLDGRRDAVHAYLTHIWATWSADTALARGAEFEALVDDYARPGALTASVAWYRANVGYAAAPAIDSPAILLWGEHDPLFPATWAGAAPETFTDVDVRILAGAGHFVPLEAPEAFAAAVGDLLARR
jgi:pimeloyl-ACP methyl ester carboxylesterase